MIRLQLWTDAAACSGIPTNEFFLDEYEAKNIHDRNVKQGEYKQRVKWLRRAVCFGCPVLSKCRLATIGEPGGMSAGVTERRRHEIRKALFPDLGPEDLLERALNALDLMDRGVSWGDALDTVGLEDHDYFLEYELGVLSERTRPVTRADQQEAA